MILKIKIVFKPINVYLEQMGRIDKIMNALLNGYFWNKKIRTFPSEWKVRFSPPL